MDLTLTDPPYGLDYQSSQAAPGRRKRRIANDESSGFEAFLDRALPAIKGQMKQGSTLYWFAGGGGASTSLAKALLAVGRHFQLLNLIVWDRVDPGLGRRLRRSWEGIIEAAVGRPRVWHGGTEQRNVLRFPRAIPQAGDHPTPRPIGLLEEIIRCAAPARGVILDPFAGSGSTLIAAERTGRVCLAAEIEPRYCDIILARWEALTGCSTARVNGCAGVMPEARPTGCRPSKSNWRLSRQQSEYQPTRQKVAGSPRTRACAREDRLTVVAARRRSGLPSGR